MKKKFIAAMAVAVVAVVAGYNVYSSQKSTDTLSDLALSNVEALAYGEVEIGVICATTCSFCWCGYFPENYWADGEPYI